MGALLGLLIPLVAGHAAIGTALAALSIPDWISVVSGLLSVDNEVVKLMIQLHPVFEKLEPELDAIRKTPDAHKIDAIRQAAIQFHGYQYSPYNHLGMGM